MITFLAEQAAQQQSWLPTLLMFGSIFFVFYFFMIRPQQKKQKEIRNFRNALSVGQDVVTIGGLHGTVKHIDLEKQTIVLRVATGVEVTFEISAIIPNAASVGQPA